METSPSIHTVTTLSRRITTIAANYRIGRYSSGAGFSPVTEIPAGRADRLAALRGTIEAGRG
jgi:hypothetical protein